jgi:hypothetical protein
MNEKIKQVLEIEKQAREIQEKAVRDAQDIPVMAEQEAQALIAKAKKEAEDEAGQILTAAQSVDAAQGVSAEAGAKDNEFEALAKKNFDQAVSYVLERVIGRA